MFKAILNSIIRCNGVPVACRETALSEGVALCHSVIASWCQNGHEVLSRNGTQVLTRRIMNSAATPKTKFASQAERMGGMVPERPKEREKAKISQ